MISINAEPKFLTARQEERFLSQFAKDDRHVSVKYHLIALLQSDCGLRITEAVSLQIKNFNFMKNEVVVKCLKKKADMWRTIPMTTRLINACAEYFRIIEARNPDDYIFPSTHENSKSNYLCRKQVWRYFKGKSEGEVNPHMLRHTAATKLIENGASLITVRDLLGHRSTQTTEIYVHASEERKREAIRSIEIIPLWKKLTAKLYPSVLKPKHVHVLPMAHGMTDFHVGRDLELNRLIDLTEKKVNVLILGGQGIGKTHLLDNYKADKILRIDDCTKFRVTLAGILLQLMEGDKEKIAELLQLNKDVITKESTKRLCDLLKKITEKNEYTIIIDKADLITPSVITALESLRSHFHFIVAARSVLVKNATWLSNFEKLELKPLNRVETMELISRATKDKDHIENYEQYKNHIWNDCGGVPEFILESVERYKKEGYISKKVVSNYRHTAALKEFDASVIILLAFALLVIIKFLGREMGDPEDSGAFKLISGVAMIFALFARQIFSAAKRRFI
jgi:integrase/recombinase XerD